jgi:hypothetical protein
MGSMEASMHEPGRFNQDGTITIDLNDIGMIFQRSPEEVLTLLKELENAKVLKVLESSDTSVTIKHPFGKRVLDMWRFMASTCDDCEKNCYLKSDFNKGKFDIWAGGCAYRSHVTNAVDQRVMQAKVSDEAFGVWSVVSNIFYDVPKAREFVGEQ